MRSVRNLARLSLMLAFGAAFVIADGPARGVEEPAPGPTPGLQAAPPSEAASRSEAAAEFLAARLLAARGAFQDALDSYLRADQLLPGDPWPDLERARLLLRLRDVRSAVRLAEEVVLRAPDLLAAHELLAEARLVAAESDPAAVPAAEAALRLVFERSGFDPRYAFDLARLLQAQGRLEEAIDVLSTATTLRPEPRLQSVLVRLMLEVGREGDAEAVLRELLTLAPGALDERMLLVEILSHRADHAAAADVLLAAPDLAREPRLTRRLAWEQARAGQVAAALATIDGLLAEGSSDGRLRVLQADLLDRSGRVGEAERTLRTAIALEPPSADAALALASLLERRGEPVQARSMLANVAQRLTAAGDDEGADELRLRLAAAQLEIGDAEGALASLVGLTEPARGLEVSLDALLALGRWQDVVDQVGSALVVPAGIEARRAEALYRLGRDSDAEEAMGRLVGDSSEQRLRLAVVVHQRLGHHERSLPLLAELQDQVPDSLEIPFRRGAALERLGRVAEAEAVFREVIARAPEFHQALNYLGYMLADSGLHLEEALALVERAVALEPNNGAYRDSLGWALHRLGRHREALTQLEIALGLTPGEPTILDHLGDVLLALGKTDPALEAWARALEHGAEDPDAVRRKIDAARSGG